MNASWLDERRAALLATGVLAAVAIVDFFTPSIYFGLLVAPPLIAAARCRWRTVAWITALSLAASAFLGRQAGIWLTPDYLIRLLGITLGGGLGVLLALERQRSQARTSTIEARYRALADSAAAGVWNITPEGRTLYINPAMCRILEVDGPEDLAGLTYHPFFTPESLEVIRAEQAKRSAGVASTYQVTVIGRRGTHRNVLISGAPLFGADGRLMSMMGTFIDITERRRLERVHTATYRISEAVHTVPTLQQLYPAIHSIVGELMPAANFYIALYDADTDTLSWPYHVDERDPPPAPRRPGRGLTELVLRTGQPLLVTPEVMRDLERRGEVELRGSDSLDWLGVPLQTAGKTIGALAIQTYTEGVRYTDAEREILQFVSTQVAMAIERKRTEEQLRESNVRLAQSQQIAHLGSWELDLTDLEHVDRNTLWWSDETFRIFGLTPGTVPVTNELFFGAVHADDRAAVRQAMQAALRGPAPFGIEHRIVRPDGTERIVQEQGTVERDETGRPRRVLGIVLDVTEERRLQEQLRQAQKMEAVGRLAGGMAHDFNNLLTAVLATADMMAGDFKADPRHRDDLEIIRAAAARGADLVRKLLAFSRQQPIVLDAVRLERLLEDFVRLARRVLPEDVEVALEVRAPGAVVRADPTAIEQVLMNLVTNARDAMAAGGRLVFGLERARLDAAQCRKLGWGAPGEYVLLSVTDTGSGMPPEALRRIFEPFFTTKPVGEGTGLGMAMVYGLVKQHEGYIGVESELGRGTTVRIYFPPADGVPRAERAAAREPQRQGRGETILVVEDDPTLRQSARRVLEMSGYRVVTAGDGAEALAWIEGAAEPPDLIISDVVMPRVSGPQMVNRLREAGRVPRVLFTTGYAAPDVQGRAALGPGVPVLAKPWTIAELLSRVREVLEAPLDVVSG